MNKSLNELCSPSNSKLRHNLNFEGELSEEEIRAKIYEDWEDFILHEKNPHQSGNRIKVDDLIKKQEKEKLSFKPTKKTIKEATKIFKEVSLEKNRQYTRLKKWQDKLSLSSLK